MLLYYSIIVIVGLVIAHVTAHFDLVAKGIAKAPFGYDQV